MIVSVLSEESVQAKAFHARNAGDAQCLAQHAAAVRRLLRVIEKMEVTTRDEALRRR